MIRNRKYVVSAVFLAVVVVLNLPAPLAMRIKAGSRDNLAPFQNVMSVFVTGVRDFFSGMANLKSDAKIKQELLEENTLLRLQVRNLIALQDENNELRRSLGFSEKRGFKLVLCRVLLRRDGNGWWRTVRLNRGTKDGIGVGMAVITRHGLVGKTIEVAGQSCDVLLITDATCKVSCKVSSNGALGIMRGAAGDLSKFGSIGMLSNLDPPQMEYVLMSDNIAKGDKVVTSGLGSVFPEGVMVGEVLDAKPHKSGLYQEVKIAPAARMADLKYVFVVVGGE